MSRPANREDGQVERRDETKMILWGQVSNSGGKGALGRTTKTNSPGLFFGLREPPWEDHRAYWFLEAL